MQRFMLMLVLVALLPATVPARLVNASSTLPPQRRDAVITIEDERGIAALDQTLRELANPFSVMYIATDPADVDEGTLALLRRKHGARVVIVFALRGEGGESIKVADTDK